MARTKKCRICGYRFRDNEDICPECFTAREDDISCEQFDRDEHSHGSGMTTTHDSDIYEEFTERSFIDEQRTEEANDPIPSSTYGGKQGATAFSAGQQGYQPRQPQTSFSQGGQSRQDKLNALRNARTSVPNPGGYNPQNVYFGQGAPNGRNVYYTVNGKKQKSNSAVIAVVVIIFLCIFFVPFIMGIVSAVGNRSSKSRTTTTAPRNYEMDISYNMPDVSFPDISVPDLSDFDARQVSLMQNGYQLLAKHITAGEVIAPNELEMDFTEEEIKTHRIADGYLPEGYRCITMDISSEFVDNKKTNGPDIVAFGCYLETYDTDGSLICTSYMLDEMDTGSKIEGARFLIPADYKDFRLYLLVDPVSGDAEHKIMTIKHYNVYKSEDEDDNSKVDKSSSVPSRADKTA